MTCHSARDLVGESFSTPVLLDFNNYGLRQLLIRPVQDSDEQGGTRSLRRLVPAHLSGAGSQLPHADDQSLNHDSKLYFRHILLREARGLRFGRKAAFDYHSSCRSFTPLYLTNGNYSTI